MDVSIRLVNGPTASAPATLLGQNLEMAGDAAAGLMADRLANPKFVGPPDPQTGIAPGWAPAFTNNHRGMYYALTPGMSLSGQDAQMMHNTCGRPGLGILQIGRPVRAGERLEVQIWARAQSHPITLRVGLRPLAARAPEYDATAIEIATTYWRPYRATLVPPQDDAAAVFFITVQGQGVVWLDQAHLLPEGEPAVRRELTDAWRALRMPVLRFPGGCISTNYHWAHGTGPRHLRPTLPDPVFKWETNYEFGTDEYLALCLGQGIQPQISVNIGSGTPDEARDWAAYCAAWYARQGAEPPEIYWQIGNEHWGAWELGNMSGEMYAAALREYVPAIRAAYPRARIVALGPEQGEVFDPDQRLPWREPVLAQAADLVDVLALQIYATVWDDDPVAELHAALRGADTMAGQVARLIADCRARGLGRIRAAVTEWNLWRRASHYDGQGFLEPYDVTHGLYVAAALAHFVRLAPDLELANFYNLLNLMGLWVARGATVAATPAVDVFRLFRPALPGERIAVEVATPELAEGLPAVDAVALRNDAGRWLVAANRDAYQTANLHLEGLGDGGAGVMLIGETPGGAFTSEHLAWRGGNLVLPPLSIVRLWAVGPVSCDDSADPTPAS